MQCVLTPLPFYPSYKGNLIRVERSREKQIVDFSTGSPWETVTLTALGRDRTLYADILQEGTHLFLTEHTVYARILQ